MNPAPVKFESETCIETEVLQKDQSTQTHRSISSSIEPRLPLPRDLSRSERGSVTVFEFCRVLQDPESPKSVSIIKERVTEESVNHPASSREEHTSNRYKYCREVIKPYLTLKALSSEISDEILKEALSSANSVSPDCNSKEFASRKDNFGQRDLSELLGPLITDSSRDSTVNYTDAITSYSSLNTQNKKNINNNTTNNTGDALNNMDGKNNNNINQMNAEDSDNSTECVPICDPDDSEQCKLPPGCEEAVESEVSESPKEKQRPPCGPPNVHIKPKCKKEVKCKPKIKKICPSGSTSKMDEEKFEVIILSTSNDKPECLNKEIESNAIKVSVPDALKSQCSEKKIHTIDGYTPKKRENEKESDLIIVSESCKKTRYYNIGEKSDISLVSDCSVASDKSEKDSIIFPDPSIEPKESNKEKKTDVIIVSSTNNRCQIEKINKLEKESKSNVNKVLTPNESAKTDATKCNIPYFPNNAMADTKKNDFIGDNVPRNNCRHDCPPCPFYEPNKFQNKEAKDNMPLTTVLKDVIGKSQFLANEDCDDEETISSSLSTKRSADNKRRRPFYDAVRCEDETDYSSPFNFECNDMSENSEHKKTLIDAHNETLLTIKVAMEGFFEKVRKKTQEAAHVIIANEGGKVLESSNCSEPSSTNAKEIISKVLTRVDSALTVLGVTFSKSFDKISKVDSYDDKTSHYAKPSPPDEVVHDHVPTSSSYFSAIKTKICSMFREEPKNEDLKQMLSPKSSKKSKSSTSDSEDEDEENFDLTD